jgi:hypothetical protein
MQKHIAINVDVDTFTTYCGKTESSFSENQYDSLTLVRYPEKGCCVKCRKAFEQAEKKHIADIRKFSH